MTERPDPSAPQTKRRRKAAPPGRNEVAPMSVSPGGQVEAATNAAAAAKRRAPRKRAAQNGHDAAEAVAAASPSVVEAPVAAAVVAGDIAPPLDAECAHGMIAAIKPTIEPAAKPNGRRAARREKSATPASNGASGRVRTQSETPQNGAKADPAATALADAYSTDSAPTVVIEKDAVESDAVERGGAASSGAALDVPIDLSADSSIPVAAADTRDDAQRDAQNDAQDDAAGTPVEPPSSDAVAQVSDGPPPEEPPHHHGWVYLALAVFALALLFGAWGVWNVFFAGGEDDARDAASLAKRNDSLRQEVATLRRSDQISREANRDLQRALAERDEEISGLRADVAFYERFVGATGQRRGLSVHDLEMQSQSEGTWHFVATLTQNLNRGAVNTGRLTVSVEGTRNDRLERLSWTRLRKQNNAPGAAYSFKYFQQVEGDLFLPTDFKPVRVTVRLVPSGGAAVEQSFAWADTRDRSPVP